MQFLFQQGGVDDKWAVCQTVKGCSEMEQSEEGNRAGKQALSVQHSPRHTEFCGSQAHRPQPPASAQPSTNANCEMVTREQQLPWTATTSQARRASQVSGFHLYPTHRAICHKGPHLKTSRQGGLITGPGHAVSQQE